VGQLLVEVLTFGALFTSMAAMRFSTNDRGETVAERGFSSLRMPRRRAQTLRILAICGVVQVLMFIFYNLPNMFIVGPHSARWPTDVQSHSYSNDGICGAGTPRACPGQGIPPLQPGTNGAAPVIGSDTSGDAPPRGVVIPAPAPN
jgi:hypothetical protein